MMARAPKLAFATLALATSLVAGCADDPLTEIVVVVGSDLQVPGDIDRITVTVDATAAGGMRETYDEPLDGAGAIRLPGTLSLVQRGSRAGPITVTANGMRGEALIVTRQARTSFVAGTRRMLRLDLPACCVGTTCPEGQTCSETGCASAERTADTLPAWNGHAPPAPTCGVASDGGGADVSMDAERPDATGYDAGRDAGFDSAVTVDAGRDGGTVDSGPPAGCMLRHPPARPVASDPMGGGVRWYAVRSFDLGAGVAWRDVSYDIDGLCTDPFATTPQVECAPPPGFVPPNDGPGGTDNSFGQGFVPLLLLLHPAFEDETNNELELGHAGVLLRVAEWNGTPTDPVVDFAIVDSPGGFASGGSPGGGTPPVWDGTDEWIASTASFVAGDVTRPLARDSSAYVVDNQLVAHPRDGTRINIASASATLQLRLTNLTVTGNFADGDRRLDTVIIAGRWTVGDLFDVLPAAGICPGTSEYTAAQEGTRRTADVTSDGSTIPFVLCNALSVGVGVDAVLATVGTFGEARPVVDLCL